MATIKGTFFEVSQPAFTSAGFNSPSGRRWGLKVTLAKSERRGCGSASLLLVRKGDLHLRTGLRWFTSSISAASGFVSLSGWLERFRRPLGSFVFSAFGLQGDAEDVSQYEPNLRENLSQDELINPG